MSQQLIPLSGGVQTLQTNTQRQGVRTLSVQTIEVRNLKSRPTEWVPEGRPIYRRLPAASETYQVNFFDILPASNTAVSFNGVQDVGYVYIPWGEGIFGPVSLEVVASPTFEDLIVKSGQVVWKYGTIVVPPAIVNLKELDFDSGRYLVAYQLSYDDAPVESLFQVEDYFLTGTKLLITSSSDSVVGWRYSALNAFLDSTTYWSNSDSFFPPSQQPSEAFIQWVSNETFQSSSTAPEKILASAYSKVVLRCPSGTNFAGNATLSYEDDSSLEFVSTVSVLKDDTSQYYEFTLPTPSFQTGWRVDFSDLNVKIQNITVSGVVTKVAQQAEPSSRCVLSIYPAGTEPSTVLSPEGEEIPVKYCNLAYIDVNSNFLLTDIQDIRPIIHRDYKPIADWLTRPFDEDLINFYEQVSGYPVLWMSPVVCLSQEYLKLNFYGVELT
jgi:hypothetical protein